MPEAPRSAALPLFFATALTAVSLACAGIPLYVIRPFRHQGAGELSVALTTAQFGPGVSLLCAALVLVAVWLVWSGSPKWLARIPAVLLALLAIGGAVMTRMNIFERMFHPIGSPAFARTEQVQIDPDDMVIAVDVKGVWRAYPVREMAYHHLVNDELGGEPIVATY